MTTKKETGNARNTANFQRLLAFVEGYGQHYNPTKETLRVSSLISLLQNAEDSLDEVIQKNTAFNTTVNDRQAAFAKLKPLATRIINALQTTDASPKLIKDAKAYNRKIQGQRSTPLPPKSTDPDAIKPLTISASQQSYVQQVQHLAGLNALLATESSYAPNEEELKITNLKTYERELGTHNKRVATIYTEISNARLSRNAILYTNKESIFETASEVKKYIKSIYGTLSPEFAQIKGIRFTKPVIV